MSIVFGIGTLATFASFWTGFINILPGIIIGLVILMLLVVAHEFGHFIMARRNGVKVNEFGIGFPPRAIAWVKKTPAPEKDDAKNKNKSANQDDKTSEATGKPAVKWEKIPKSDWTKPQDSLVFSINWLPIGGFCSLDGESAADKRKGTFGAASFWAKTKILFGGVVMNWLVAFIVLTVLAWTGMPQFIPNQFYLGQDATEELVERAVVVGSVLPDSPAEQAGFQAGDTILEVGDGQKISQTTEVTEYGLAHAGEEGKYKIERGDEEIYLTAQLNDKDQDYVLGVSMQQFGQVFVKSTWSAPIVGAGLTLQLTGETFKGLGELVWNLASGIARQFSPDDAVREEGRQDIGVAGDSVSGPVGIIGVIFPTFASAGASNLAFLAALISISLACMNVLPIPALDGGRWLLIAIYKLRKKQLTKEAEEKIVSRAFMVLLALIALVTVLDIFKLF